jgi:mycothiol synthase
MASNNEALPQLLMRLTSLADLPGLTAPEGYTLREATPADLPALSRCLAAAFPEIEWSEETTRQRLFDDISVTRVFMIEAPDGAAAATASARLAKNHPDAGYVHWVGADPAHAGRGLGRLVTLAVLHEFVRQGFTQSVLETDDFRLPAIRLYQKMGFVPEFTHPSFEGRWAAIAAV